METVQPQGDVMSAIVNTKGAVVAVVGGAAAAANIDQWVSIIGTICAIAGATAAVLNYIDSKRLRQAQFAEIEERRQLRLRKDWDDSE